jgi:hypothetical protein
MQSEKQVQKIKDKLMYDVDQIELDSDYCGIYFKSGRQLGITIGKDGNLYYEYANENLIVIKKGKNRKKTFYTVNGREVKIELTGRD